MCQVLEFDKKLGIQLDQLVVRYVDFSTEWFCSNVEEVFV